MYLSVSFKTMIHDFFFQSVRTTTSKHPVDYKRKYLGIKRMIKQLVFVCTVLITILLMLLIGLPLFHTFCTAYSIIMIIGHCIIAELFRV